jgi:hypothetical protein
MTTDFSQDTIDWKKLASLCGYTHSTAQKTYSNARRKLREFSDASDSASTAPPKVPESNVDADASAPADNGNKDDQGTPPKKARKARRTSTPRKRKAEKQEDGGKDDGPDTEPAVDEA